MRVLSIVCGLFAPLAAACASQPMASFGTDMVGFSGSATYLARIAMPSEAVLTVRIENMSTPAATVLAELHEPFGVRQVPIPFELKVPRAKIDPKAHYRLTAEISAGGQKRFAANHDIPSLTQGAPEKLDLLLPPVTPMHWRGEFTYMADAAHFLNCADGRRWPVANAGDYLAVERGYLDARSATGAPLIAYFEGHLEIRPTMEGPPREHMVIDRLSGFEPGARCTSAENVSLLGTPWKLVELDGQTVEDTPDPLRNIVFTLAATGTRVSGFGGCNNLVGGYESSTPHRTLPAWPTP